MLPRRISSQGKPSLTAMPAETFAGSTPDWAKTSKKLEPGSFCEVAVSPDLSVTSSVFPVTSIRSTFPSSINVKTWEMGSVWGEETGVVKAQ